MGLEMKEGQVFKIAELAYRNGLVEKAAPVVGEALQDAQNKTGFKTQELVEFMNEMDENWVRIIDAALNYAGPVLALMGNEKLMGPIFKLGSKLLDLKSVQAVSFRIMRKVIEITFNWCKKYNARKVAELGVS